MKYIKKAIPIEAFQYKGDFIENGEYCIPEIVYDTETKVMYAVLSNRSMTLLVDENGKPKLWKE